MNDNTTLSPTPDEKWSLAHLGEFCVQRFGKMASDAWWIGKAMRLAKEKAGGKFKAWKLKHGFSDSMASRYMRLCEAYKSPELLEGKRIYPALEEAGIPTRSSKSESALAAPLSVSHMEDASTEAALSWAIPDDADEELPQCSSVDGPISEPCPVAALREHVEVALPFAIEQLIQAIDKSITSERSLDDGCVVGGNRKVAEIAIGRSQEKDRRTRSTLAR